MAEALIRIKQVTEMTTLSRSEIYRRVAAGSFPHQQRLSHRRAVWRMSEIQAWIDRAVNGQ